MSANPETTPDAKLVVAQRAKPADEKNGIRLSEPAAEKVREHIEKSNLSDSTYLYVGVKGGGCAVCPTCSTCVTKCTPRSTMPTRCSRRTALTSSAT